MKPWDPPEQNLYPVLDDLLSQWAATVPVPYDGIRVAGTLWSASCYNTKDFLARNGVPYQWLDVEADAPTRELVESVTKEQHRVPVVFFPMAPCWSSRTTEHWPRRLGCEPRLARRSMT